MTVITNASIVGPHAVRREAWLAIEDGTIHRIGDGAAPSSAVNLEGAWVVPGFVDLHMHGGGGHSVVMGDAADVRAAGELHRRRGTTTTLVSLVTAPAADMTDAMAGIANLRTTAPELGRAIAGIHAEGPFLAT